MRKLIAAVALSLVGTSAQAEVHNIQFGEHSVRIEIPKNCRDLSCIRLSTAEKPSSKPKKTTEPPAAAAKPAPNSRERAKTAMPQPTGAPVPAAPRNDTPAQTQLDERRPVAVTNFEDRTLAVVPAPPPSPAAEQSAPKPDLLTVYDPKAEPARSETPSPIGVWLTENRDGKIRIEPCGAALCGFVDGRPSEKVLINMKPTQSNRWSGKINDVRSGGTYMANITLKNANSLRVEGCAFGGMFCGGETWSRIQ